MDFKTQWRPFGENETIRSSWKEGKRNKRNEWAKFNKKLTEENTKNKRRLFEQALIEKINNNFLK